MASESVAISHQRAGKKLIAAMGTLKLAKHALQARDMNDVEEDLVDSLQGVIGQLDDAYVLIMHPES